MKFFMVIAFSLIISFATYAADSSSGCGLGWQVFKKNSLVSSSLRATTNTFFLNTIAMTMGTSGCAKHSIVKNEMKGIHYAESNFDRLMIEMAQGSGEYLEGFAYATGHKGDNKFFNELVKNNYSKIFTSQDITPIQMYDNFKKVTTETKDYLII